MDAHRAIPLRVMIIEIQVQARLFHTCFITLRSSTDTWTGLSLVTFQIDGIFELAIEKGLELVQVSIQGRETFI